MKLTQLTLATALFSALTFGVTIKVFMLEHKSMVFNKKLNTIAMMTTSQLVKKRVNLVHQVL